MAEELDVDIDMSLALGLGDHSRVVMAHGGGGSLTNALIEKHVLKHINNDLLSPLDDGATFDVTSSKACITTDGYVVRPIEFPGGDIGRLAVCGTVNDLAVMGATPKLLSLSLILEEGLSIKTLDRVMRSLAETAQQAGVKVVTGDTKVIERRGDDGLMIVTTGFGELSEDVKLSIKDAEPGDVIIVSGNIAEHGLAVMSAREDLSFDTELRSDVAPLNLMIKSIWESGARVRFMRDATRGGIAGVLTDIAEASGFSVAIAEKRIPISATCRHAAEMLGLDPLNIANEGKIIVLVPADDAKLVLNAMREHPCGSQAMIIGKLTETQPALVELVTEVGGKRLVSRPYGEDLPRIC